MFPFRFKVLSMTSGAILSPRDCGFGNTQAAKSPHQGRRLFQGRDDWTRTSDLVVPNDARYQLRHIPIPFVEGAAKIGRSVICPVLTL